MKLYYSKGACSLATRIIIAELNLPCEYISVNLGTKKTQSDEDFLKINPKGAVPALELDDGTILTENAVIQQYLADTHHANTLLPTIGHLQRYRVLEWLNFVGSDLHKTAGALFNQKLANDAKEDILKPNLKKLLSYVDHHLAHNLFLTGNDFTLPDGYLFVILTWLKLFNLQITDWHHLSRYFNAVKTRKAVQQALQAEGLNL